MSARNRSSFPTVPRDPRFATTLAHGLAVLEAFDGGQARLNNKALAQRTGLSKATISRLSSTLQAHGLLAFDPGERQYSLAAGILTLGYPFLADLNIRREARCGMKQLADALGASVSLGVRERSRMIYVETCRSNNPRAFCPDVGASLPMLQTAMGRAWLAAAPRHVRKEALQSLQMQQPEDWHRWRGHVHCASKHLARHGFCLSQGHWQPDVCAIAVPLKLPGASEVLILNCGLPMQALRPGELYDRIAPQLIALARQIEKQFEEPWHDAVSTCSAEPPLETPGDDAGHVRTLSRGLALLQCFCPGVPESSHARLAHLLRLPGPTVARLTWTLTALGYLRRSASDHGYQLGAATVALAYPLLVNLRVRQAARPGMIALSDRVGAAVSLGFQHRIGMVYVESAWRGDGRQLIPDTGAPMPMLSTAMGRAWLAHADSARRASVLNRLRLQDPAHCTDHTAIVEQAIKDLHRKGYCSARAALHKDIYAFAVPFSRPVDGLQLVMNCGVFSQRFSFAEAERRVAQPLKQLVRDVEVALGLRNVD